MKLKVFFSLLGIHCGRKLSTVQRTRNPLLVSVCPTCYLPSHTLRLQQYYSFLTLFPVIAVLSMSVLFTSAWNNTLWFTFCNFFHLVSLIGFPFIFSSSTIFLIFLFFFFFINHEASEVWTRDDCAGLPPWCSTTLRRLESGQLPLNVLTPYPPRHISTSSLRYPSSGKALRPIPAASLSAVESWRPGQQLRSSASWIRYHNHRLCQYPSTPTAYITATVTGTNSVLYTAVATSKVSASNASLKTWNIRSEQD